MPMDDQFRIRCDKKWKAAIEDVAFRQRLKFADWVRQALGAKAIAWFKAHGLPVPIALVDLSQQEAEHANRRAPDKSGDPPV